MRGSSHDAARPVVVSTSDSVAKNVMNRSERRNLIASPYRMRGTGLGKVIMSLLMNVFPHVVRALVGLRIIRGLDMKLTREDMEAMRGVIAQGLPRGHCL